MTAHGCVRLDQPDVPAPAQTPAVQSTPVPAPEPITAPRERCEQYYGTAACDHAVAPQPSSPPETAYAPTLQSTTPTSPAEDALLLYPASEGRALYTYIDIGPWPQRMLVDTGSTRLTVNESLAQRLLARGLAHEGPQGIATLADGSQREQQSVIIGTVTIGSHVLHGVLAGVSPDGSDMLLGLWVLNKIGRFTIDGANHKLIFGP